MYSLILTDPPWQYTDKASAGKRGAEFKYPCMSISELQDMKPYIDSISAPDSVMYMWTTGPMLLVAGALLEYWGFTYKTTPFLWIKTNTNPIHPETSVMLETVMGDDGMCTTRGDFMGMGNHVRSNGEMVLLGIKGKGIKRVNYAIRQPIISPRRQHSRKPEEVYQRLEHLYGDIPRIEMFSRCKRPGWDQHGNQMEMFITK